MSKRPRRTAAMKLVHVDQSGEQFHLDQVKLMKRGILLKNFSIYNEKEKIYQCRFLNCTKPFGDGELMSLSAHLLIHVRDSSERSLKNPKFYENLIFYSVPKEQQLDICSKFNDEGEKVNRRQQVDQEIPWMFQVLKLTRRKKIKTNGDKKEMENGIEFDACDVHREWKRYCFLARKNHRIESVEISMRDRHVLPSPITHRQSSSTIISSKKGQPSNAQFEAFQHRRFSIFNPLTNQVRQSVIQLNLNKPLPNRARKIDFNPTFPTFSNIPSAPTDNSAEQLNRVNRPTVICPNPTKQYSNHVGSFNEGKQEKVYKKCATETSIHDDMDLLLLSPNQFEQLKRNYYSIKSIMERDVLKSLKVPQKRKIQYEIPKKLQAVTPDSIFTIKATFSTFGTRGKTRRVLDLCGPDIDDDEAQFEMAIRASLEQTPPVSSTKTSKPTTSCPGHRRKVRSRRSRNSSAQLQQIGEVTS